MQNHFPATGDDHDPADIDEATPPAGALQLAAAERRQLRAAAHHLDPVIMIGDAGLTPAVVAETDRALDHHQLIKVRVLGDDRTERVRIMERLCAALGCAPVQMIGKLLVLWRPADRRERVPAVHIPKKRAAQALEQANNRAGRKISPTSAAKHAIGKPAQPRANSQGASRKPAGGVAGRGSSGDSGRPASPSGRTTRPSGGTARGPATSPGREVPGASESRSRNPRAGGPPGRQDERRGSGPGTTRSVGTRPGSTRSSESGPRSTRLAGPGAASYRPAGAGAGAKRVAGKGPARPAGTGTPRGGRPAGTDSGARGSGMRESGPRSGANRGGGTTGRGRSAGAAPAGRKRRTHS